MSWNLLLIRSGVDRVADASFVPFLLAPPMVKPLVAYVAGFPMARAFGLRILSVPLPGRRPKVPIQLTADATFATPAGGSVDPRDPPFFTTRAEGTGLGVLIARSAIVQHGGTLEFTSHAGGGAAAPITLPRRGERPRLEVEATRG